MVIRNTNTLLYLLENKHINIYTDLNGYHKYKYFIIFIQLIDLACKHISTMQIDKQMIFYKNVNQTVVVRKNGIKSKLMVYIRLNKYYFWQFR